MALNGVILHSKRSKGASSGMQRVSITNALIAKISMIVISCANAHMQGVAKIATNRKIKNRQGSRERIKGYPVGISFLTNKGD
jgi:hypothetical protein